VFFRRFHADPDLALSPSTGSTFHSTHYAVNFGPRAGRAATLDPCKPTVPSDHGPGLACLRWSPTPHAARLHLLLD